MIPHSGCIMRGAIEMINKKSYVKIEKEGMEAWIYLYEPVDAEVYEKREIIKFLKDNNINYGYNESNIAAICKKKIYEREICVAKGQKGLEGHSGYYEYFFETDLDKLKKPSVLANGSVDYRSVSLLQNVNYGDLVARYHPAMKGTDGMDVTGTPLRAPDVKELLPVDGKGVERSEKHPDEYYAALNGRIEYDRDTGKVSVIDVHYVNGDADLANNPVIEFNGDIVITGSVESGVVIRAGRSLSIDGVVEAADLEAGGDIIIKRGVLANGVGRIVSRSGDVMADFIEHGNVRAKGKVQANIIMNSTVVADGKVMLEGRKGYIMGGYVHGLAGVKAVSIGNDAEIKTRVHAGCEPKYFEQKLALSKQLDELEEELTNVIDDLKALLKIKQVKELADSQMKQLGKLKDAKEKLELKHKKLKKRLDQMEAIEAIAKGATIRIEGAVYRGTTIALDSHEIYLDRDTSYMEYENKNGIIEGTVVVVN